MAGEWDSYTGANERYEHTVRGSLDARIDEVGAVGRTPAAGIVKQSVSDGNYGYAGRSDYMFAPKGTTSTPFRTASAPEFPHLEPLPGLPLLALLHNLCPKGVTSMPVGAAMLAPSGVLSMPFGIAGVLELVRLEPLSTPG